MKICFYNITTGQVLGGLEIYCLEMGRALARRGHDVTLVAGTGTSSYLDKVELKHALFPFHHRSRFPDFGTRFRKLMERLSFGRHAWRHLLADGYDVVIITKPFDFPVLWWARRHGLRARTLFHSGGTDFFPGDRWFAHAVDHWAACSRYTAAQTARRYQREVKVIHNGVDTQNFAPGARDPAWRMRWNVPASAPTIISVGRLVGLKGLRVIVEALADLPDAHYVAVGEGPERPKLEEQAAHLGVLDRVHFLGGIAHEQLPAVLREADVFVQPSIGEEAFGIAVIEAMACGLPVVASRNGGMLEIVADGQNGMLAPVRDVPAWREILQALVSDKKRMTELGTRARVHIETNFTWDAKAAEVEKLLHENPVRFS
jgi:glycosyltransferase involved in cell wall biosynthesis